MHRSAIQRALVLVGAFAALTIGQARAGEFRVANCQSDQFNFSTEAFTDFATRGMVIKRACNPEGPGLRGLITANYTRSGRVPRGAVALVTIQAPPGTRFARFTWAGTVRRRDCTYALQLYAAVPGIRTIPIKNVRANEGCPTGVGAQAAGYLSRTFDINGATRIVQRVICVGGHGRRSCSSRSANYIQSYKAEVDIVDVAPPTVTAQAVTDTARQRA